MCDDRFGRSDAAILNWCHWSVNTLPKAANVCVGTTANMPSFILGALIVCGCKFACNVFYNMLYVDIIDTISCMLLVRNYSKARRDRERVRKRESERERESSLAAAVAR